MFDIVSYIREKIFRRPKFVVPLAWEELSEKKTTKLWYFLLYCMFGAILGSAQWTLSIIEDIPQVPTPPPSCVASLLYTLWQGKDDGYYGLYTSSYRSTDCSPLASVYPKFDLSKEYAILSPWFDAVYESNNQIQVLESKKGQLEYAQRNSQQDYNTSLMEKTAREDSWLYNGKDIQGDIKNSRSEIQNIENQIAQEKVKIQAIQDQYRTQSKALYDAYIVAQDNYRYAMLLYRFYVAILSFSFALVVFIVLYNLYVRQKIKNSPFTIIFSVATFAYGLVLLEVAFIFISDIIPHKFLAWLGNLFSLFTPLVYLVQFLWPIVIIAIFGFAVFKIQKRLYSEENILKRFISDKKCPNCDNSVDFTKPFCPLCAHEIQIPCPHCTKLSLKGMPYCSSCGGEIIKKDSSHKK